MEYSQMFDRNIGVFSIGQQEKLKSVSIAIIGCGGMGGISAQIAARSGIENISVADPDKYEEVNINNQFNAFTDTMGRNKAVVVSETLKKINPAIKVTTYKEGLNETNVNEIVDAADIILDCVDYNELYYSYLITNRAMEKGKFVLAPQAIGYGASVLVFDPNGMSFNDYLGLKSGLTKKDFEKITASPEKYAAIIPKYISNDIVDKVVKKEIPIPNIALAQTLASSVMVAESIFILLKIRKPTVVPKMIAIDLFENRLVI